jgi:pimeloyl-ACP methyl ester carboxylesterase
MSGLDQAHEMRSRVAAALLRAWRTVVATAAAVDAPMPPCPVHDGDAGPEQPVSRERARRRARKWLRRLGISAFSVIAVATAFSLLFNAVTQPPPVVDPGFGAYVRVGAAAIHYQTWGTSGIAIVLVPGFLESSTAWSAVGPLLGEDHLVYALDLPGDGYTRYVGPLLLHNEAELVEGFIRALHLQRPILVGHSLGAAVVGAVALAHPQQVRKVIFADGDGLSLNLGPRWIRSLILASPYMTTVLRMASRWTPVDKWFIKMTCGPQCPAPSTALTEQWVKPLRQLSSEHALHELMVNSDYGLTPQQISAISVPSAIIWGSDDHDGGSLTSTIVNLHHPPVHIISNAGHLTMIANPKAFAQAVES